MDLDIQTDVRLDRRNTFGLPARAERLATCTSVDQVAEAARLAARQGWPVLVLGGGSNLILTRDVPGLVIAPANRGIVLEGEDARVRRVRVAAGEVWHAVVMETLARGWRGLENLALIPGTVGAAPVQNIGAYGVELDSVFESLTAVDLGDGSLRRFERADCGFAYRDSRFKREDRGRYAIVDVTFALPVAGPCHTGYADVARELAARGVADPDARAVAEAVIAIRRAKLPDPAVLGNAGSFFKNPVVDASTHARLKARFSHLVSYPQPDGQHKLAAGWLIDHAGWKGRSVGDAAVYERQALVLVNRGHATGADVLALARAIQDDIRARFGVELESEPVWV